MSEMQWELLTTVEGRMNAEYLITFLQAEDVPVQDFQESFGVYGAPVTFGPLGEVQIFVPKDKLEQAQTLLKEFERGVDMDAIENTDE